jgi:hypothetical protein
LQRWRKVGKKPPRWAVAREREYTTREKKAKGGAIRAKRSTLPSFMSCASLFFHALLPSLFSSPLLGCLPVIKDALMMFQSPVAGSASNFDFCFLVKFPFYEVSL